MATDDWFRDLERRALDDPWDDVAWAEWRTALAREGSERHAALRRVVRTALRFASAESWTAKCRDGLANASSMDRQRVVTYLLAGVHATRARDFRRALMRLKRLSDAGQRMNPGAIVEALGLGDRERAALRVAFAKALAASGEAKRKDQGTKGAGGLTTVLARVLGRGINPNGLNLSVVGRRAAAAHRERHGGASPARVQEAAWQTGVMAFVFAYEDADLDLVDREIDRGRPEDGGTADQNGPVPA